MKNVTTLNEEFEAIRPLLPANTLDCIINQLGGESCVAEVSIFLLLIFFNI